MRDQGATSERFRTIRFEDVVDAQAGYSGLREIALLAGVDLTADQLAEFGSNPVNAPRRLSFPPWQEWSNDQLTTLVDQCADEAHFYGYKLESEVNALVVSRSGD
jgi:hypothetical protein